MEDLENEKQDRDEEKNRYLKDKHPPLQLSGLSLGELQVIHSVRQSQLKTAEDKTCCLASIFLKSYTSCIY